jgi:predicted nucleotide-binding protein (sugar kinase/HSP70/actin superfamily)
MDERVIAERVNKRYRKNGGTRLDLGGIIEIIKALLPLLAMCAPLFAKRHAKKHPEATKERMANRIEDLGLSKKDRDDAVNAAYDELVSAKNDDLQEACDCAN